MGGWPEDVLAPSAIAYNERLPKPKEMTKSDIENVKKAWLATVERALVAGFDVIEIHNGKRGPALPFCVSIIESSKHMATSSTLSSRRHRIIVRMSTVGVSKTESV